MTSIMHQCEDSSYLNIPSDKYAVVLDNKCYQHFQTFLISKLVKNTLKQKCPNSEIKIIEIQSGEEVGLVCE